jgi:hypothetical protein
LIANVYFRGNKIREFFMSQITEKIDQLGKKGAELLQDEELKARLNDLKGDVEGNIRKHPIVSMLAAVAAGYILGKLFGGR